MVMDGSRGQNPGTLMVRMVAENSWWMDVDLPISTDGKVLTHPQIMSVSATHETLMQSITVPKHIPHYPTIPQQRNKWLYSLQCGIRVSKNDQHGVHSQHQYCFFKISTEISIENGEHVAGWSWFTGKNSAGWTISLWRRNSCCWSKSHFFGLGLTGMSMNRRLWHVLSSVKDMFNHPIS